MKNKQGNIKLIFIIVVVALLIAAVYYFGFRSANVGGSNLGYAKITGMDASGNNLIIDATVNLYTNNGALGLPNTNSLTSAQCLKYGWTPKSSGDVGYIGYSCNVYTGIDMTKFSYTSNVQCTHSCTRCTAGTVPYTPGFDGSQINYGDIRQFADDLVSCSGTIVVIPKSTTAPIPVTPQAHGFSFIINSILAWIKSLFTNLGLASIQGVTAVQPNTVQTYNIALTAAVPDSIYTDGTYQVQYANWALVDSSGNIIQQGSWEQVYGTYTKSVTLTTPSNPGNYILLGVITQYDMTYNFQTSTWTTGTENIVTKEAINLQSKYVVIAPTNPQAGGFANFINSLISWFKNLFGIK